MPSDEPTLAGEPLDDAHANEPGAASDVDTRIQTDGGTGAPPPGKRAFEPGDRIGRFVVLAQVGAGGMGIVFAAYDPELDRRVAIKLLLHDGHRGEERRMRLLREAQAMARLSHPNVMTVYDVGTVGEDVYIAMEFVDGCTLGAHLKAQRRSVHEILDLFRAAGRGLAAAHAAGLVHRDFKPENVLVDRKGRVRVMDFGLATVAEDDAQGSEPTASPSSASDDLDRADSAGTGGAPARPRAVTSISMSSTSDAFERLTRTGAVLGTPAYMSPEQHMGMPADARSDQFSFCVALYEALYGTRPFPGDTHAALALNVLRGNHRPVPARPRVPYAVRRAIVRGLSANPEERFPDMEALLQVLDEDTARVRRRRLAAVLVGVAAIGSYGVVRAAFDGPSACSDVGTPVAAVWNEDVTSQVLDRLGSVLPADAEKTAHSAVEGLSAYASAWKAARRGACEDARVRKVISEEVLDARVACLDDRLRRVRALVAELRAADRPVALKATSAVEALPEIAPCGDAAYVLARWGHDRDAAPEHGEAADRLAGGFAKLHTGRYDEAIATAEALLDADAPLPPALRAGALVLRADTAEKLGRFDEAQRAYEQAFVAAMQVDAFDRAFEAARGLVHTLGYRRAETEAGLSWASVADELVTHLGDVRRRAELDNAVGSTLLVAGLRDDALERYERGLRRLEGIPGADTARAWAHNNLAVALAAVGRLDEAFAQHQAAYEVRRARLGPGHPDVAVSLANLAAVESARERLDEAERLYRRAYEIRVAALGPEHVDVAGTLNNLGSIAEQTGRLDEAARDYAEAHRILGARLGPGHPNTVVAALNRANVQLERGDVDGALRLLEDVWTQVDDAEDAELAAEVAERLARARLLAAGVRIVDEPDGTVRLVGIGRASPRVRRRTADLLDHVRRRLGSRDGLDDPDVWDMVVAMLHALGRSASPVPPDPGP